MIKLYREENSSQADAIEAEFKDMVLSYERVTVEPAQAQNLFGETPLPVITNNDLVISGEEIKPYLNALEKYMYHWQTFQGDTCYVGEDGTC